MILCLSRWKITREGPSKALRSSCCRDSHKDSSLIELNVLSWTKQASSMFVDRHYLDLELWKGDSFRLYCNTVQGSNRTETEFTRESSIEGRMPSLSLMAHVSTWQIWNLSFCFSFPFPCFFLLFLFRRVHSHFRKSLWGTAWSISSSKILLKWDTTVDTYHRERTTRSLNLELTNSLLKCLLHSCSPHDTGATLSSQPYLSANHNHEPWTMINDA